jgi:hypothetical protein
VISPQGSAFHRLLVCAAAAFPLPPTIAESTISIKGRLSESQFGKAVVWLVGSRLAGTLLVPSALLIVQVARLL